MIAEIRMYIAEKVLGWLISVVPDNKEGDDLLTFIHAYFEFKVNEQQDGRI